MEPFSKEDPLHHLLGKSRTVEPRPNFTQNVLRAARQEPQHLSLWERCSLWMREGGGRTLWRGAMTAAAVVAIAVIGLRQFGAQAPETASSGVVAVAPVPPSESPATVENSPAAAELPVETVAATELEDLDELSMLLAQRDPSALSDSDIAALLY